MDSRHALPDFGAAYGFGMRVALGDDASEVQDHDGFAIELDLDAIPLLPGAAELLSSGIESTLAPSNRAAEAEIESTEAQRRTPQYAAMFDPQTSGGLLMAVGESDVVEVLRRLEKETGLPAAVIGRVTSSGSQTCPIRLVDLSMSSQRELCRQ